MPTIASDLSGAIGYSPNAVYLPSRSGLMPKRRRAWGVVEFSALAAPPARRSTTSP